MDELAERIARVREELGPTWDEQRAMVLYAGVGQRRRRRAVRRAALGALAVAGIALAIVARTSDEPSHDVRASRPTGGEAPSPGVAARAPDAPASDAPQLATLRLSDGSLAEFAAADSDLRVVRDRPDAIDVDLATGRAKFDVVPNPTRRFVVRADGVAVIVVGTRFEVVHAADGVQVAVERGKVRVERAGVAVFLSAGESRTFAPTEVAWDAPAGTKPADARKTASWRSLGQNGDYDAAYRLIEQGARIDDEPSSWMDAADAARLSGHPREATGYLERLVRGHDRSPLAPLAAFTLGRVYLDQLGEPARAARAFADARRLAPDSSLAPDAMAREVEALSKAGDAAGANQRAREYAARYPGGRRLRAVRLYGHLE
jgi:transmembrane sensor